MNNAKPSNQLNYPNIRDVYIAHKRIKPFVVKTPLIASQELSLCFDKSILLKLENLQEIGAFKIRGAANKILSLSEDVRSRGVATFSTGNHGLAVAYMAKKLAIPAYICISSRVPDVKVNSLKKLGANIEIYGKSQDEAERYCYQLAKEKSLTIIEPFDDPFVIAGQGTIGLEIIEVLPNIDTIIVPVSGGGLCAGIALVVKTLIPGIRVVGVSMENGAVMYHSLKAGKQVALDEVDTLADSLLGGLGEENKYTFSMLAKYIDEFVLVSEEEIAQGMSYIFKNHKMVVEGAAATGVAALLKKGVKNVGDNVVTIISGNNVNISSFVNATKDFL
ncbi:MAG: threonine/serine dehydratase [Clostridia bacterium]|jgi:threonine dehydratase|uniref:threonine/serine dehydratase n=1 Tax=Desulfitibacter alkalitolerans TaxID=264641 RepID=UPI000554DF62|nr:threonine/serine dehydratase [Desulfitibacter alkalitolerans]MBS3969379.1 threonine/serine dehydratase [Clostridia bacterium]